MRKYLAIFIAAIFVFGSVFAQPQVDDVSNSLNKGEVSNVVKYFDKIVDITINNDQSTYSKSQAEMVVKSFFSKNQARSFFVRHKGVASSDNSVFVIGELKTANGPYRVYIFFKQRDKNYWLQQIKFEQ
ncbi:DUF4783 domain-containing protein [Taibaiella koreensis]|uniref:DUF4783 domain-containing protein n=1 Tax=Taibaiella koreensis TaxID=1268548 RepID=UPI000E59F6D9|nr:DUF4783 domain-containing protein [Taibaiella koreensis]